MGERIMAIDNENRYYDVDRRSREDYGHNANLNQTAGHMNHPMTHYGNTAEYLVSGYPFFQTHTSTGTSTFGYVTQWVCISAIGTNVTVTIDGGGAAFTVPSGTISPRFDFKCTSITVTLAGSGSACVSAGLTNVAATDFPDISTYTGVA